jgi:hypothetical protein
MVKKDMVMTQRGKICQFFRAQDRLRTAVGVAGVASLLLGGVLAPAQAQTSVWLGGSGTGWSIPANWVGGVPPISSSTTSLFFGGAGFSTTNDIAALFQVNALTFQAFSSTSSVISSSPGNAIQMAGSDATITQNGTASVLFTSNLSLLSTTTIGGSGGGNVSFQGVIGGTGGLVIATNPSAPGVQQITLGTTNAGNTFTGGVTLQSGNLVLDNETALGTGALTVNGGTLAVNRSITLGNQIVLNSTLTLLNGTATPILGSFRGRERHGGHRAPRGRTDDTERVHLHGRDYD